MMSSCTAHPVWRISCCAAVLALLICVVSPQCVAAKLHQHHTTGVYLTHDGQLLQALAGRDPSTYWIDGYQMVVSNQTQICWHDVPLTFGFILNRDGQPIAVLKATAPCGSVPPSSLKRNAWLQYQAVQQYVDVFKPGMKIAAIRIDVWKSDGNENQGFAPPATARPVWQALCASASPHQLRYPNEGSIDVVCDAKVNSYIENVFSSLVRPSAITGEVPTTSRKSPAFYVVRPFQAKHNYDFEAIDGYSGYYDLSFLSWYRNPHANSLVQEMVYSPDGAVLIPDIALSHLKNESQFASLLSYSLAAENQNLIGRLFRVQRFKVSRLSRKSNGGNNLLYMVAFITELNKQVLRLGIRRMYLAGYDIRYAPYVWAVEQGKRIKGPIDVPHKHMPWYATYAFNAINQLYPNVDYSKLKRGRREYQQFLQELRKADPEAFRQQASQTSKK